MKFQLYAQQIFNKALPAFLFCLAAAVAFCQPAPAPQLINCPGPGLGIKNLPLTISIDSQPITVYASINNNVYNLNPNSTGCGITIKPATLLLPRSSSQAGGFITYTFSAPVSNVQIALQAQNIPGINQLAVKVANDGAPVTPTLTVFNSSADSCPGSYTVSKETIQAHTASGASATMVNIGGAYFTTLTLQNTSENNSRSWIDLRLCNVNADCRPPEKPILGSVLPPAQAGANGSFNITNYKAIYSYIIIPSAGVVQNRWKITAPANQSYSVTAVAGSCKSEKSSPITITSVPPNSNSPH